MPITRRHFELGIDSEIEEWMRKIYEFLETHIDQAFNEVELMSELQVREDGVSNVRFRMALERLVELNVADTREVASRVYYATGRYALADILKP